jgi:hypothetical protein
VLRERVGVTRERAAGILEAWLARQAYLVTSSPAVGDLRTLPFLRIKTDGDERVMPLVALPSPALAHLAQDPAEFVESDDPVEGIDRGALDAIVGAALDDPSTRTVQVEIRGYYPAQFAVAGDGVQTCTAVVGAGQGPVHPDTLPARALRRDGRLRGYLVGLAVILVAEAAVIPGVWPAAAAVIATSVVFCASVLATGVGRG